jgi:hypothetical protein
MEILGYIFFLIIIIIGAIISAVQKEEKRRIRQAKIDEKEAARLVKIKEKEARDTARRVAINDKRQARLKAQAIKDRNALRQRHAKKPKSNPTDLTFEPKAEFPDKESKL